MVLPSRARPAQARQFGATHDSGDQRHREADDENSGADGGYGEYPAAATALIDEHRGAGRVVLVHDVRWYSLCVVFGEIATFVTRFSGKYLPPAFSSTLPISVIA
jgi:hypothetical protein